MVQQNIYLTKTTAFSACQFLQNEGTFPFYNKQNKQTCTITHLITHSTTHSTIHSTTCTSIPIKEDSVSDGVGGGEGILVYSDSGGISRDAFFVSSLFSFSFSCSPLSFVRVSVSSLLSFSLGDRGSDIRVLSV
jgi:hypothetical protein